MKEEIAEKLGRNIDLRTPEDISKLFRNEVLQQSHLIYGQERFKSLGSAFYRGADAFFIVYDITERKSFKNV